LKIQIADFYSTPSKQLLMKKLLLTLVGICILFVSKSLGQETHPTKGYYSIKGKSGQVPANRKPVRILQAQEGYPTVTKGYYSMPGHEKKLPKELRIYVGNKPRTAQKGYYSVPRKQ